MNENATQTALEIIKLEQQLQQVPEQVKAQIEFYNKTKQAIADLKQKLKETTEGRISESVSLGDDTLDLKIYDSTRVYVQDANAVPKEFTTPIEQEGVYLAPDGNFYKDEPNVKQVSNLYKAGADLPNGFEAKTTRSISIKYNGQVL